MNEDFFKSLNLSELKTYKQRLQIRNNDMNNMVEYMKKENENLEEMKSFLSNHQQHITLLLKRQETREYEKKARNKIFTTIIQNGVNMLPANLNPKNLINYFSNIQNNEVPDQQLANDEDYQKQISNQPNVDEIIYNPNQSLQQRFSSNNNIPQQNQAGQRQRKKIFEEHKPLYNPLVSLPSLIQQNQQIQSQQKEQQLIQQSNQIQQNEKENDQNEKKQQFQQQQQQYKQQPPKQQKQFEEDECYNIEQDSI
ncbi:hypothetical protein ABPG74_002559 [Tetrahymena malaccensis]